jgi:toxin ParE1/3/4
MRRYVLSPLAKADLDDIWNYSVAHWSVEQAESYMRQLHRAAEIIATTPARGKACDELRPGYRKYPVGSHILFYRLTDAGVDIVRILHQRMDFDLHL